VISSVVSKPFNAERAFKRLIVTLTALGFGGTLALLACLGRGRVQAFDFHWHWSAMIWGALGISAAVWFWRQVWRVEANNVKPERRRLLFRGAVLCAGAVAGFFYPIIFVPREHLGEVLIGLAAAVAVLSLIAWVIHKLIRMLSSDEPEDGEIYSKKG
jgi:hypothetical protein